MNLKKKKKMGGRGLSQSYFFLNFLSKTKPPTDDFFQPAENKLLNIETLCKKENVLNPFPHNDPF